MGARLHPALDRQPEIVDLRRLSARDLAPLLEEETDGWRLGLQWDFSKSANLVRRFVDLRALSGAALVEQGKIIGYIYYVLEEAKGLIGDLYIRRELHNEERENTLLRWAVDAIMACPAIRRIESQLMMFGYRRDRELPGSEFLTVFERNFMLLNLETAKLPPARVKRLAYIERWIDQYQDSAAQVIADAYAGHVDSLINDQYRDRDGARRFLFNIVQYPGCGEFFRPGSLAAFDAASERMAGISLASVVSPECGHITQLCVAPQARGTGLGYEMMRKSLAGLAVSGSRRASLTVTAANTGAVALYERMGFKTIHRFPAFVWEGF
jgi:ribosomal protein S18 acetylase RimI-like enzyme